MKCRFCGKKGVSLSHFPKKHGALLRRKSAAARKKAPKARSYRKGKGPTPEHLANVLAAHFCPVCGRLH